MQEKPGISVDKRRVVIFNRLLFAWHKNNYREMAWRRTRDPYRILISEIMLQQTQVDRVRSKYQEFLKAFPNMEKLAKAPLGEVLRMWSGLGYNRRAKYLHLCAQKVVEMYGGKFPKTYSELAALPGIGMSTAGALLAFSFNEDTPMIDTNIRRILCRVFFKDHIPRDKELYQLGEMLIPKGKGREWNYAMLDLGATLCTARRHSSYCPLGELHGKVGDFVYKKPQKKFAGSRRFYRGQILKHLGREDSATTASLSKLLKLSKAETSSIVLELKKESLLIKHGVRFALPK